MSSPSPTSPEPTNPQKPHIYNATEEWPTTGEGTFDLPPLETAANPTVMNWRGVRFADVAKELYYENDSLDFSRDFKDFGVCAKTGKPPDIDPTALVWLKKHAPAQVNWENMTAMAGYFYLMSGVALREASRVIGEGFTNSVPVQQAYYSNFHMPDDTDFNIYDSTWRDSSKDTVNVDDSLHTLTLAVSYAHKVKNSETLLNASQFQIAQLEDILTAIREHPPANTEFVRLWTDKAHSIRLAKTKGSERPKWIFSGLFPYAVFPVALLSSGEETDNTSMWSSCEQILGDGALGCLFSMKQGSTFHVPQFAKLLYCSGDHSRLHQATAAKTIGDGLSINRNLTKLAAAIHSGVLDDTVTFHIADAQHLIRLAYYMTRMEIVSVAHAANCEECLHATYREHQGFVTALHACCDLYDENSDEDILVRRNKTRVSYPYPKVRARRGYVDWHGLREFAPGAGRFAKDVLPVFLEKYKKNTYPVTVYYKDLPSWEYCLLISAYPCSDGPVRYMVLLVHGRELFSSTCRVLYSVRLNIIDLPKLHNGVQRGLLRGKASEHFRHPKMDDLLSCFEMRVFLDRASIKWGMWGLNETLQGAGQQSKGTARIVGYVQWGLASIKNALWNALRNVLAPVLVKLDRYLASKVNARR